VNANELPNSTLKLALCVLLPATQRPSSLKFREELHRKYECVVELRPLSFTIDMSTFYFYRATLYAMLHMLCVLCLLVCPSNCLSQFCVISKHLNTHVSSRNQCSMIAYGL